MEDLNCNSKLPAGAIEIDDPKNDLKKFKTAAFISFLTWLTSGNPLLDPLA